MITETIKEEVKVRGFVELAVEEGMTTGTNYTAGCSGARSDCCTRTCSNTRKCLTDDSLAGSNEAWEDFLFLEGGEIQY